METVETVEINLEVGVVSGGSGEWWEVGLPTVAGL